MSEKRVLFMRDDSDINIMKTKNQKTWLYYYIIYQEKIYIPKIANKIPMIP